jgi:anti-sigma regulatory factor (Ser/Thr protein kinase)
MDNIFFQISADLTELNSLQLHLESMQNAWLVPRRTVAEINLVLEEIIVNIIEHGNLDNTHVIDITLTKVARELTIRVVDDGPPFDLTRSASPDVTLPLEQRTCGGLGIHLVHSLCRCCNYIRSADKNVLTLKRTLPEECR